MHEDEIVIAEDDDVDPPERSDRVPLMGLPVDLLGVNYGAEPEFDEGEDEFNDGENEFNDENAGFYKVGETIGEQILDPVGENPSAQVGTTKRWPRS